jgi:hypothetical protein
MVCAFGPDDVAGPFASPHQVMPSL